MIANEAGDSVPRGRPTYEVVRLAKLAAVPKILHFLRVTLSPFPGRSYPSLAQQIMIHARKIAARTGST